MMFLKTKWLDHDLRSVDVVINLDYVVAATPTSDGKRCLIELVSSKGNITIIDMPFDKLVEYLRPARLAPTPQDE